MRLARLALLLALAGVVAGSAHAAGSLRLTELGDASFPDRAYILSLPEGQKVAPDRISVEENGGDIVGLTVTPATAVGQAELALAILIDASDSMRGRPIEAATQAARVLAGRRKPSQQLAVVSFNAETTVLLRFTLDEREIQAALASPPPLAYYTRMYDAIDRTLELVREAKIHSASIVLLSDGQELDSRSSLEAAVEAARAANVRIFGVGLHSRFFEPETLKALAHRTGGSYFEAASPDALAGIFADIGSQLANEHIVRYRSLAGPEERAEVVARVAGIEGVAVAGYVTPRLPVPPPGPPYQRSQAEVLWASPEAMLVVALLSGALMAIGTVAALRPTGRTVLDRVSAFVSLAGTSEPAAQETLTARMLAGAERSLEKRAWWDRFKEALEIAEIRLPALHLVVFTVSGTLAAAAVGLLAGSRLVALLALVMIPLFVRMVVKRKLARQRTRFAEQLPDNLQVLASALRAGHSLVGALAVVVNDASEPSRREFGRVLANEQLGVRLEDALDEVAKRMDCRELEQVALVAAVSRDTGGNTAEVLDRVTDTVRARFELRRLVRTLTAQGRMARWVVSALPGVVLAAILVLNPGYMTPMLSHPVGQVICGIAVMMVVLGSLAIRRIVTIKV